MEERTDAWNGISMAAWGYIFLYIDIHLGRINLLPQFVGYLLFFSSIRFLQENRPEIALLRPLGTFLAVWHIAAEVFSWAGGDLGEKVPFLNLLVLVVDLYFSFQFLTDCADLAAAGEQPKNVTYRTLLFCRNVRTVLITVCVLLDPWKDRIGTAWASITVVLAVASVMVGLVLVFSLFCLRQALEDMGTDT